MKWWAVVVAAGLAGLLSFAAFRAPSGPRSIREFDPDRMADLELRMWQAYYAKERLRLFALLTTTLREQYHYSWVTATGQAFHLARAASTFAELRSGYEVVLPDLESAYQTAAAWLGARFDPNAVARAELAWWVARRVPGRNSPEQVGQLIAEEYVLLYDAPLADMVQPGVLRAEAGALRDAQAQQPEWETIRQLLTHSYRQLRANLTRAAAD